MGSPTDEELMERFCHGEQDAFEALFARHAGRVRGFLARMVRDGPLAEDLLQTALLKTSRRWSRMLASSTRVSPADCPLRMNASWARTEAS